MVFYPRLLLQKSSLMLSLASRNRAGGLVRQFAVVTTQNHLHFHQNFKYNSSNINSSFSRCAQTITGLVLSNSAGSKSLFYQQSHLLHNSQSNFLSKKVKSDENDVRGEQDEKPLGLVGKFKKMAKEYWYVLIPVHCLTSCFWFGGFYYASVSGFDIVGFMEHWHISETIIEKFRNSTLGHVAIAYLLYKIATPARYTVTLGGTTFAINFLSQRGYIKPIPSKDQLVQMYKDKKEEVQQKVTDTKIQFHEKLKKDN